MRKYVKIGYSNRLGDENPFYKHGMTGINEYIAWKSMKQRCYNKNIKAYNDYGGRGIIVCDEWLNDFIAFFNYIGVKPNKEYSLDRINNNGNYEPGNVRWANKTDQINNRRIFKNNKSGIRGIGWNKKYNKWIVRIMKNYKSYYLGSFHDINDAIKVLNEFIK